MAGSIEIKKGVNFGCGGSSGGVKARDCGDMASELVVGLAVELAVRFRWVGGLRRATISVFSDLLS